MGPGVGLAGGGQDRKGARRNRGSRDGPARWAPARDRRHRRRARFAGADRRAGRGLKARPSACSGPFRTRDGWNERAGRAARSASASSGWPRSSVHRVTSLSGPGPGRSPLPRSRDLLPLALPENKPNLRCQRHKKRAARPSRATVGGCGTSKAFGVKEMLSCPAPGSTGGHGASGAFASGRRGYDENDPAEAPASTGSTTPVTQRESSRRR
jgi:hypothetical protein